MIKLIFDMTFFFSFVNAASDQKVADSQLTIEQPAKQKHDNISGNKEVNNEPVDMTGLKYWLPLPEYPGMTTYREK